LNRRSQRRSYNWIGFSQMWKTLGMLRPQVVERPYRYQTRLELSNVYA
jgi:hypothetical protein